MLLISRNRLRRYLLMLLLLLFLAVELPIIAAGQMTKPEPSDVIIVLGAKLIDSKPSTMLRLRLDEAIRLFKADYAPTIIVSGAKGRDEEISEASAMKNYLIDQGIDPRQILIEDQSYNTYQNLIYSQAIMKQHGMENAIIVSNASHIRRSLVLASNLKLHATGSAAPMTDNLYLTVKQYLREGAAMVSVLLLPPT